MPTLAIESCLAVNVAWYALVLAQPYNSAGNTTVLYRLVEPLTKWTDFSKPLMTIRYARYS